MVSVAQHLRGSIGGGIALLRVAATAPRPPQARRPTGRFALVPESGFAMECPADTAELPDPQAASAILPATRTASRARSSRPATRRPGGARRPAAKGGRGRGPRPHARILTRNTRRRPTAAVRLVLSVPAAATRAAMTPARNPFRAVRPGPHPA